jgi:hypothetical protein
MSKLHDRKKIGVIVHTSQEEELSDTRNKDLYRPHPCHCPECKKNFRRLGDLIEHQDAMQCGIIRL